MKIFLYIIAVLAFIAPIILWAFAAGMSCMYVASGSSCGASLEDFLDWEFLYIAAAPWFVALVFFFLARSVGSKSKAEDAA